MALFPTRQKLQHSFSTKKRSWVLLILGCISLILLALLIYYVPPTQSYTVISLDVPILPFFFILVFLFLFGVGSFIFKSKTHGILMGLIVVVYLIFRQNDLTHPFFAVLLAALFLVLELLFSYKK